MRVIGIIAEYNPFHNGHAYQLSKVREETGADYIAVAMSGDFVQRGEPAIIDKYARAEMALQNGADLVLELPALWASSSAESFAMAGVSLFEKMGCVEGLCFGAETDNLPLLTAIADLLADEPTDYRRLLSSYLKEGMNFPAARARALCGFFQTSALPGVKNGSSEPVSESLSAILNSPNNILAIEYLKALRRLHSSIKPILLKRVGAGYHDEKISDIQNSDEKKEEAVPTASAAAIRKLLFSEHAAASSDEALKASMPDSARDILADYVTSGAALSPQDFSFVLGYRLLTQEKEDLSRIGGITPELANRLYNNRYQYCSFSQFCELNKSREVTYTRISRILLHLILQFTQDDYALGRSCGYVPYLRILGFRKSSSALLSLLKNSADIPMLSKLADAPALLSPEAGALLEKDIFAANLYEQTKAVKSRTLPRNEYSREIVRLSPPFVRP